MFSVLSNFTFGWLITSSKRSDFKKIGLYCGLFVNLIILIYYKYLGFFISDVFLIENISGDIPHLPLGISFFTFQAISYLVDVYRRDADPAPSLWHLMLYITMFPQLIAGPIVRYASVAKEISHRIIDKHQILHGTLFFVFGLSQKVLIANNVGAAADATFSLPLDQVSTLIAWIGSICYMLQIYFDFSGYSNMAIGIGLLMGFHFPKNFDFPYTSKSITEFWRRWHISLSSWFRDYLYIPLGGNRNGTINTYFNLLVVFLLCGLWHGASWTFVIWGLYHGILLVLERVGLSSLLDKIPSAIRVLYTLFSVLVGWVIFRSETFTQASVFLKSMAGNHYVYDYVSLYDVVTSDTIFFAILGMVFSSSLFKKYAKYFDVVPGVGVHKNISNNAVVVWGAIFSLYFVCITFISSGSYNPFIYYRF